MTIYIFNLYLEKLIEYFQNLMEKPVVERIIGLFDFFVPVIHPM